MPATLLQLGQRRCSDRGKGSCRTSINVTGWLSIWPRSSSTSAVSVVGCPWIARCNLVRRHAARGLSLAVVLEHVAGSRRRRPGACDRGDPDGHRLPGCGHHRADRARRPGSHDGRVDLGFVGHRNPGRRGLPSRRHRAHRADRHQHVRRASPRTPSSGPCGHVGQAAVPGRISAGSGGDPWRIQPVDATH